jgi:GAF domain-containing protein
VVVLAVAQGINGGKATWVSALPLQVAYVLLLVCLAVAVLRYRLFDVDVLLNRAFVLGMGTLFAACAYVVVVVLVGGALGEWAGSYLLSVAATVVIALAFQPLRRRLVRLADRLAYGPRAAPYDALAAFSRSIGSSPAPDTLLPAVAEAAAASVSARSATVTVDIAAGVSQRADWPPGAGQRHTGTRTGAEVVVPVTDRSGELGRIAVSLVPGHTLRPAERRLLDDIADQAALAFRNTRLEAELRARVEMLDRQTEALAASRRRLIEAGDVARRRLEAAIAREVLPTLERLHADLAAPAAGSTPDRSPDGYVEQANAALDSLRELTRGIFPTLLTRSGLGPALTAHFTRTGQSGGLRIDPSVTGRRFPARVEAAAYQCATDAAAGAAGDVHISLVLLRDELRLEVRVLGSMTADRTALADRVEAVGGSLEAVADPSGRTSCLRVRLPADGIEPTQPAMESSPVAAAHSSVSRSGPKTPLGT